MKVMDHMQLRDDFKIDVIDELKFIVVMRKKEIGWDQTKRNKEIKGVGCDHNFVLKTGPAAELWN